MFGLGLRVARTLNIAALNRPIASGPLLVRVPFNPGDLNHYYTVEFRRKIGNDIGIPADIVLIHEVKKVSDGTYRSHLLRDRTTRNPVQFVNANGVTIAVNSVNSTTNQAMLTITSQIVNRCLQGYVWREAQPGDLVCVVGSTRTETRQENLLAASRRSPTGGAYGPDTCLQGYVWREAYLNDHVCVPGYSRSRAWADNAAAWGRVTYN